MGMSVKSGSRRVRKNFKVIKMDFDFVLAKWEYQLEGDDGAVYADGNRNWFSAKELSR